MTRKKLLILLGSVCLALMLIAMACAAPAPPEAAELEAKLAAEKAKVADLEDEVADLKADLAAAMKPAKVFEWSMTGWPTKGISSGIGMAEFCDMVTEMSGGRIDLMATYEGEVLMEDEQLDGVATGVCEVGYPWPGTYGGRIPEAFIETGLPLSLSNPSEVQTLFWRKGWVDILTEAYAANNLYYAGFIVQAPVPVVSTVPINSLADLKGLKVRSVGGPPAEVLVELGAAYTYISFGEVYMGLMMGTIDAAAAGSIMEEYDIKLYESCPYYLRPDLVSNQVGPVVVNMDAWNSLTPDLQEIIISAAKAWARNIEMREWEACITDWVDWETNWDGEKCYIPDSELPEVYAAAARVWETYGAATPACGEMIEILSDYMRDLGYIE